MARIRLLQQMSGSRNGVPWPAVGAEMDVPEDEAVSLCSGQTPIAERADAEPEAEPEAPAKEPLVPEAPAKEPLVPATRAKAPRATQTAARK